MRVTVGYFRFAPGQMEPGQPVREALDLHARLDAESREAFTRETAALLDELSREVGCSDN